MSSQAVIQRILRDKMNNIFEENPHTAFTVDELHKELNKQGNIDTSTLFSLLRQIISNGKVRVVYGNDKEPQRYKAVPPKLQEQFISLDDDYHRIYDLVDKAGNKGIWRRDLKKTGGSMSEKQLSTVLNELESRFLIKSITSIHEKKLKLYLLYDMNPSEEITGGVWYLEGTFNTNFVEQLIKSSTDMVHSRDGISLKDMVEKIKTNSLASAHITDKESEQVITAMVHSKKVLKVGSMLYPGVLEIPTCPIAEVPCCGCPLATRCYPGGPINPRNCSYLQKLRELF